MKDKLNAVKNTLNMISVSGYDNLIRLLGCLQTIDAMLQELEENENERDSAK